MVTLAQYMTELVCERKAVVDNNGDLPQQFWKLKKWEKYYKSQIPAAVKLSKQYRADAIISALNDKRTFKTYSLRSPFLIKVIEEYNKVQPKSIKQVDEPIKRVYDSKGQFGSLKKSSLEDLD